MIWCTNGMFTMGSPAGEPGRFPNEVQHFVTISRGFWMSRSEVTQGQWKSLMNGQSVVDLAKLALCNDEPEDVGSGNEASKSAYREVWPLPKNYDVRKRCGNISDDLPVYYVSWDQAMNFCARLTKMGRDVNAIPPDYEYRLPTETEWEYACRAGSTGSLPGNLTFKILAENNAPSLGLFAWYGGNSSMGFRGTGFSTDSWEGKECPGGLAAPRQVETRRANKWGFHDMLGNVWEWCYDWYGPYENKATRDPVGPAAGNYHVVRGGSWSTPACMCRPAYRDGFPPGLGNFIGIRVVLAPAIRR